METTIRELNRLSWYKLTLTIKNRVYTHSVRSKPWKIVDTIVKKITSLMQHPPEPGCMPWRIKEWFHEKKMHRGAVLPVEISFIHTDKTSVEQWIASAYHYFKHNRTNYELVSVSTPEKLTLEKLLCRAGIADDEDELCLDFLMPFSFKREPDRPVTYISKHQFTGLCEKRIQKLFHTDICYTSDKDDFELLPYYWEFVDHTRQSKRDPSQVEPVRGCAGKLYIKGQFKDFLLFIVLCLELNIGNRTKYGQGYYTIKKGNIPYFIPKLTDRKFITGVIRQVIAERDDAPEDMTENYGFDYETDEFVHEIEKLLMQKEYNPVPYEGFIIKKRSGKGQRLIEKLQLKDMVVQKILYQILYPVFDRAFEKSSSGYRKKR